jgi:putative flippase GtrA
MNLVQPGKFLLVGTGGYFVNLAVFAGLHREGVTYLAASLASYFVANGAMYFGNRRFTFALCGTGYWSAYLRYLIAGGAIAGLNALLLAFLVEVAGWQPTLSLAVSLLVLTPAAFVLTKHWTLRPNSVAVPRPIA